MIILSKKFWCRHKQEKVVIDNVWNAINKYGLPGIIRSEGEDNNIKMVVCDRCGHVKAWKRLD